MSLSVIDASNFKRIFFSGANNLSNNKEYINELNVFPVPDGDTGTNMTLTVMTAVEEMKKADNTSLYAMTKAVSNGSLRGARGNSGVILSQLFRGFYKSVKHKEAIDVSEIALAFVKASETAYKAVQKPKEGTILTVARAISDKAVELSDKEEDIVAFSEEVLRYGEEMLFRTPDMLAVLKEAGVVDSGGQGLIDFLKGCVAALNGEDVAPLNETPKLISAPLVKNEIHGSSRDDISTADIKFTYCTEFIVKLTEPISDDKLSNFKKYLQSIGDSLVCVADEELIKIHVHSNHPGLAFEKGLSLGSLSRMKIDNMKEEHGERVMMEYHTSFRPEGQSAEKAEEKVEDKKTPPAKFGFVSIAAGSGLEELMKEIKIDHIISGGQTMNPSTDDILSAVEKINAENIYVFPNNSNIILAANQAASLVKDKNIIVVPSTSIPHCISAMITFSPDASPEENLRVMTDAMNAIRYGEVTYAVRDTSMNGKEIKSGDIMALYDKEIKEVGDNIEEVTLNLIDQMTDDDCSLITVYYGEDITESGAEMLKEKLAEKYPDYDIDLHNGGQPLYYYYISVE